MPAQVWYNLPGNHLRLNNVGALTRESFAGLQLMVLDSFGLAKLATSHPTDLYRGRARVLLEAAQQPVLQL
jgi:hypothetical protein